MFVELEVAWAYGVCIFGSVTQRSQRDKKSFVELRSGLDLGVGLELET